MRRATAVFTILTRSFAVCSRNGTVHVSSVSRCGQGIVAKKHVYQSNPPHHHMWSSPFLSQVSGLRSCPGLRVAPGFSCRQPQPAPPTIYQRRGSCHRVSIRRGASERSTRRARSIRVSSTFAERNPCKMRVLCFYQPVKRTLNETPRLSQNEPPLSCQNLADA